MYCPGMGHWNFFKSHQTISPNSHEVVSASSAGMAHGACWSFSFLKNSNKIVTNLFITCRLYKPEKRQQQAQEQTKKFRSPFPHVNACHLLICSCGNLPHL